MTPIETIHGRGQPDTQWCLHHWSDLNLRSHDEKIFTGKSNGTTDQSVMGHMGRLSVDIRV